MPRLTRFRVATACLAAILIAFVAMALHTMISFERLREAQVVTRYNGTWVGVQLRTEVMKFLALLDRYHLGDTEVSLDDLTLQYEVMLSRFPLMTTGVESAAFAEWPDLVESMQAPMKALVDAEPVLHGLSRGDVAGYWVMRAPAVSLEAPASEIITHTLVRRRIQIDQDFADVYTQMRLALIGGLIASIGLAALLFLERHRSDRRAMLLTTVLEAMDQGVTVYDRDLGFVIANRRVTEMGFPEDLAVRGSRYETLVARGIEAGFYGHLPEDRHAEFLRGRVAAARRGEPAQFVVHRPDGKFVEIRRSPMPDGGFVTTYTDVTASKRGEEALHRAKEAAESANRAKSEFLANMSHELRTPLNAVIGFSEVMKDEILGPIGQPQYLDYAADIHKSGQHLLLLINDILDLAKIEAGRMPLRESVVRLEDVISFSVTAVERLRSRADVRIKVSMQEELPALQADERMMKQICVNLLSNAVKFAPSGTVEISAGMNDNGELGITVADNGIGMSPDELARAFEPFYQAESGYSRRFEGSGLGLPLVRGIVRLHGGTVSVSSERGLGTTVTVTLPGSRVAA